MPYIGEERRIAIDKYGEVPDTPGELNFALTRQCLLYLGKTPRYADINEVIGALECCKLEMYRRVAIPLEESKILENGDVY